LDFMGAMGNLASDLLRDGEEVRLPKVGTLFLTNYNRGSYLDKLKAAHTRWHHGPLVRCDICRRNGVTQQELRGVRFRQSYLMRNKIYGVPD